MNVAFISAILPVLILLIFVYRKDRERPEPLGKLVLTFIVGGLISVPVLITEQFLSIFTPSGAIASGLFDGYVVAGLSEEFWKLLLLLLVIWRSRYFDEYFDGIIYATFLSMGFACVENVLYVMGDTDPIGTAFMRGILAVPAHFLFAVTMGYYVSLAKFDPAHRSSHLLRALLFPVLLHGTYDALLMVSSNLQGSDSPLSTGICIVLFIAFTYFDIKMWRWGLRRIARMQERSREQGFDRNNPFEGFNWNV